MKTNTKEQKFGAFCDAKFLVCPRLMYKSVILGLVFLFISVFGFLSSIFGLNDSVSATGTTSDSTITINTSGDITLAITPTGTGSTVTSSDYSFSVSTNNYTGYTLSINTSDDTGRINKSTACISDNAAHCYFSSIDDPSPDINYNNTWGYKPSYYNSTINTEMFYPAPLSSGDILRVTSSANATGTSDTYTIAVGARANTELEPGTYARTFTIVAVGNPVIYDIEYTDNTGTGGTVGSDVSNLPVSHQSGSLNHGIANLTLMPYGLNDDNSVIPERTGHIFVGWCSVPTTDSGTTCSGTTYTYDSVNQNYGTMDISELVDNTNIKFYALWMVNAYTQTTMVRYENADGTWSDYTEVDSQDIIPGNSYSWSTDQISNFDSAMYQTASVTSYTVTEDNTNQVSIYRNTFTCSKQYRLETAAGGWGDYNSDGAETVRYGGSCSYSKTVTDYKGSSGGSNGSQGSTSASNITDTTTLSLSFYRNTYTLTVSAGSNTSSPSGSGSKRWGETVTVSVTKASNVTCTTYATPTWSATAGTAPSAGASSSYTMPKSNATVTATSSASNVAQTVTLSRGTGVSSIRIGSTNYSGTSVSLNCGTYNISGNYDTYYTFSSWSRANGITVASTSSSSTTMTVSGAGTLTLYAKADRLWFQDASMSNCGSTMYDKRSTATYKNIAYSTAKIGSLCWMTRNLDLPGGTYITSSDSHLTTISSYTLPASSTANFDISVNTSQGVYNSGSTTCSSNSPCYSYYTYATATAGTNPQNQNYNATDDICPKGWRLPTQDELLTVRDTYNSSGGIAVSPFNGVYAGAYNYANFNSGGTIGYIWSATTYTVQVAYRISFNSSNTNSISVTYATRGAGMSIRCVKS